MSAVSWRGHWRGQWNAAFGVVALVTGCGVLADPVDPFAGVTLEADHWSTPVKRCGLTGKTRGISQLLLLPSEQRAQVALIGETGASSVLGVMDWTPPSSSDDCREVSMHGPVPTGAVIIPDIITGRSLLQVGSAAGDPGLPSLEVVRFDLDGGTRSRVARISAGLLDPAVVRMANGALLALGGLAEPGATSGLVRFDAEALVEPCASAAACPELAVGGLPDAGAAARTAQRPRAFLLPRLSGGAEGIWLLGDGGLPLLLSLAVDAPLPTAAPADRPLAAGGMFQDATAVLLPLGAGAPPSASEQAVETFLVVDGTKAFVTDAAVTAPDLRRALLPSDQPPLLVLLPDGRVLVLGGGAERTAYLDPRQNLALSWGQARDQPGENQPATGRDSAAVLLFDGSVLVATRASEDSSPATRILSPPYVTAHRPVIEADPPATISYRQPFDLRWQGAGPTAEVVLMAVAPSVDRHGTGQRHVTLSAHAQATPEGGAMAVVDGPPSGCWAPPGWYLLFVVDERRVPSVGRLVRLVVGDPAAASCAI